MGFTNPWLEKRKKRKCEYRPLSKREIKVIEPHKVKPKKHGSKHDLSVCKASGEVVQHPKTKHYDKDGNLVYPGDTHYEPTGININEPPWKELLETMIEGNETKVIVEFRVMDFARKPHEVLKELGLSTFEAVWEKGRPRTANAKIVHEENGFSIAADRRFKTIEERVSRLVAKLIPLKERLKQVCGDYYAELSCVVYVAGDGVPAIHFSDDVLGQLADLKAEIDIDLYFTSEE